MAFGDGKRLSSLTAMVWPIIALLVTLARGLPRNCAGPTALPDDFLLPEADALDCGLPVSRSYLLSAHNMVLVVEAPAEAPVAGEPYSMTVRGCDAAAPGPWTDAYSFAAPDFAWCEPDALELWARARGPTIEVADVTPSATECAWTLAFPRGLAAGDYEIDVLNIWLRGWAEPANDPERERKGVALAGEPFDWRSPPLKRGSPFMPCVQRCMLFEQCVGWTQYRPPASVVSRAARDDRPAGTRRASRRGATCSRASTATRRSTTPRSARPRSFRPAGRRWRSRRRPATPRATSSRP